MARPNLRMYYFYVLRSLKNEKLYIGWTVNLEKRLLMHNSGNNLSTKPHIPYEIIFYSVFKNKLDATNCEKYFKTTAGWRRLHRMLESTLQ